MQLPLVSLSDLDQYFETPQKVIWGLERLIYEANAFDFRVRKPLSYMVKIAKHLNLPENFVTSTLWATGLDLYRTYIPLKSTTFAMALACIEFAALLENRPDEFTAAMADTDMPRYHVTRDEIMGKLSSPPFFLTVYHTETVQRSCRISVISTSAICQTRCWASEYRSKKSFESGSSSTKKWKKRSSDATLLLGKKSKAHLTFQFQALGRETSIPMMKVLKAKSLAETSHTAICWTPSEHGKSGPLLPNFSMTSTRKKSKRYLCTMTRLHPNPNQNQGWTRPAPDTLLLPSLLPHIHPLGSVDLATGDSRPLPRLESLMMPLFLVFDLVVIYFQDSGRTWWQKGNVKGKGKSVSDSCWLPWYSVIWNMTSGWSRGKFCLNLIWCFCFSRLTELQRIAVGGIL